MLAPGYLTDTSSLFEQGSDHFSPRCVPACSENSRATVRRLARQRVFAFHLVESGPPLDQLLNPRRALLNQNLYRFLPAESVAGTQRVFPVHRDVVLFGSDGDAALRVDGATFRRTALGENDDATGLA